MRAVRAGTDIDEAMKRGQPNVAKGYTYSFDALGEAARTDADALRYRDSYARAIAPIGRRADQGDVREKPATRSSSPPFTVATRSRSA